MAKVAHSLAVRPAWHGSFFPARARTNCHGRSCHIHTLLFQTPLKVRARAGKNCHGMAVFPSARWDKLPWPLLSYSHTIVLNPAQSTRARREKLPWHGSFSQRALGQTAMAALVIFTHYCSKPRSKYARAPGKTAMAWQFFPARAGTNCHGRSCHIHTLLF